jgi:hypothetical protein
VSAGRALCYKTIMSRPPKQRPRPLADLVEPCISAALQKKGFSQASIIMYWPDIVGGRLAEFCEPLMVQWPARGASGTAPVAAALVVRVAGGFAIELQHLAPLVIERINSHLGWCCIGKIVLKQGPLTRRPERQSRPPPPAAAALSRAASAAADIEESDLRAALTRLGARIFEHNAR